MKIVAADTTGFRCCCSGGAVVVKVVHDALAMFEAKRSSSVLTCWLCRCRVAGRLLARGSARGGVLVLGVDGARRKHGGWDAREDKYER